MDISVIIVNYNVKYYTALCLNSVQKAIGDIETEIWIVDNASSDDSVAYLQPLFPKVKWIINTENKGFGAANNQAARQASGEYILLLNPDTIIAEDTLSKCLHFMQQHPDAGALGVKMIDTRGQFLRESKRGIPTLFTAFYKMAGLAKIFPHSSTFAQYYLGHLPENENNKVEILAGAFMLISRKAWNAVGGFDEDYFMYGEDIDLSYRMLQAGFNNYYLADTAIIHFKGESTRQKDARYVKMFYQAMQVFIKKHNHRFLSAAFAKAGIKLGAFISLSSHQIRSGIKGKLVKQKYWLIISGEMPAENWIKELQSVMGNNIVDIKTITTPEIFPEDILREMIAEKITDIIFYISDINCKDIIDGMQKTNGKINYFFILPGGRQIAGHHKLINLPRKADYIL